ncbi:MAG: tetratricopeptide repeat protein, partial [Candidatus Binataceae bacterium]
MRLPAQWALMIVVAASMVMAGCARLDTQGPKPVEAVSNDGERPFGGKPAIEIPKSAYAMGAFLQAEVATERGDREEALKSFEEAVKYDPDNAMLHVQLATLYV